MKCDVVTVSTDTQFVHLAWQQDEKELAKVRYPMGADPTGNVARLFGVYDEATGLALRGTFIINPEGTLLNAEVNFYNLGRNIDELMRKFKANVYMAKKANEVCVTPSLVWLAWVTNDAQRSSLSSSLFSSSALTCLRSTTW